jgi:predicted ATPase/DNA-binding SARP family transcriptional activator
LTVASLDRTTSQLAIRLFGPFEARQNGDLLPRLRTRKGEWLLALLALRGGRAVDRAWLAALLWPDSPEPQSLANLRNSLKDLRRALGPEANRLRCSEHVSRGASRALALELDGAEVDVLAFDAAVARDDPPALERAVSLYRGPLLEGCVAEWAFQERQVRERAYLDTLERLAAWANSAGDLAAAERYLRLAVAVDSLRESVQRELMRVLAARGNYASALVLYRDLRVRLHGELKSEPDPATTALFQRIRAEARGKAEGGGAEPALLPIALELPDGRSPLRVLDSPLPSTLSRRITGLPTPLTPLLGRERELATAWEQLMRDDVRLLTLTGAGGSGKTRLGLAVATDLVEAFEDGVHFVGLAPLRDPGLFPSAICQVLGVRETDGRPLLEVLRDALREKQLLLLLDNFEHLIEATPVLASLLEGCPRLKALVTSRTPLRLRGEHELPVPPLALPNREGRPAPDTLAQVAAVALFLQRAVASRPGFALTEENAPAVAEICRRLDGLPLAIELAAGRIKLFSPPALLRRLESRLTLLTGGHRDLPARQQTLRDAIAWSHDLLPEGERRLFRRLSVFAGGATLAAAASVCDAVGDLGIPVLDGVASLLDQNLLLREEGLDGEPRVTMLETIREFALESLAISGETVAVRRRHAGYYQALAETAAPALVAGEQQVWLDRLEREHDNLRAALAWLTDGDVGPCEDLDEEAGMRMGVALLRFWHVRGHYTEGRQRLEALLQRYPDRTAARASVLYAAARLAFRSGDYEAARARWEEALAISHERADTEGVAGALGAIGWLDLRQGNRAAARALFEEGLALCRDAGDRAGTATALGNLGSLALDEGECDRAQELYEESLAIKRARGDRIAVAGTLHNLSNLARVRGDFDTERRLLEETLSISREIGDRPGEAGALGNLAAEACRRGDLAGATRLAEESLAISRAIADQETAAFALESLGRVARAERRLDAARSFLEQSLAIQRRLGASRRIAAVLEELCGLAPKGGTECTDGDSR